MKVLIAMSGGVDSSAAALLLRKAGHECAGATMRLFQNEDAGIAREKSCCSLEDVTDAKMVCAKLGMRHYVFNLTDRFREAVMRHFAETYAKGATPNPCIDCNRFLKFDALMRRVEEMGFDRLATGHYARVRFDEERGRFLLLKAKDARKDQSYVLYAMTQAQLSRTYFPLGEYTKPQVRALAEENGFLNAQKRESQDICFVPDGDYAGFLERFTGKSSVPGDFVDKEGKVLGRHLGIEHYTIGQARGLGLSLGRKIYVCAIDAAKNTVTLGEEKDLYADTLTARDVNFIACASLPTPLPVEAKIRYAHKPSPALAWMKEETLYVRFETPQRAITPGQAVVLYQGDLVLGGGTITGTL